MGRIIDVQLWAAVTLTFAAIGCGGQSGAEGGSGDEDGLVMSNWPGPGADCVTYDVDELDFDPWDVERMVVGTFDNTLRWQTIGFDEPMPAAEGGGEAPVSIEVRRRGPVRVSLRCGGAALFDVDVDATVADGRVAEFRGQVVSHGGAAYLDSSADPDAAEILSVPGPAKLGVSKHQIDLGLVVREDGVLGSLDSSSESTGECVRAMWPAAHRCGVGDRELDFDTQFGDFQFAEVLDAMSALPVQEVSWADGSSTTLEIALERDEAGPLCAGDEPKHRVPGYRGRSFKSDVQAKLKTADGKLDVRVPAQLWARWSPEDGLEPFLSDTRAGTYTMDLSANVLLPEQVNLQLSLRHGPSGERGTLQLHAVEADPALLPLLAAGSPPLRVDNLECLGLRGGELVENGMFTRSALDE